MKLAKTKAAIETYDAYDEQHHGDYEIATVRELERLGELVGQAFGEETADRNDPEVCRQCVRPGPKTPRPGYEPGFVRRMVELAEVGEF